MASSEIDGLIALMAKLPGLGPRSARRAVLHLVRKRALLLLPLSDALLAVAQSAKECADCGNITTEDRCEICTNPKRLNGQICVVEDVADLWAMERSGVFRGVYHILGGALSALDGIGPEELRIPHLIDRAHRLEIEEVVLALKATVDGQTTAHYIAQQFEGGTIAVTSLAQGIPIGGELDYLDDGTIMAALSARRSL